MAVDGLSLNMISETPEKKLIKENITFINPEASNNDMTNFIVAFTGLSQNNLKGLQKTQVSTLTLPSND